MGDPSTWDTPCVLTHTIMSLKAAVFLSLLGAALALDHANCDVDNNDCSCADKAYDQCAEPNPTVSIHVGDLQECILNCDLFATFQQCDWLVYYNRGPDENCHLFAQGETMQQYLDTCNTLPDSGGMHRGLHRPVCVHGCHLLHLGQVGPGLQ